MVVKKLPEEQAFLGALFKVGSKILPALLRGGKVAAKVGGRAARVAGRGARAAGRAGRGAVAKHATKATAKRLAKKGAEAAARAAATKAASMAADKIMNKNKVTADAAMPQAA